MKLRRLLHTLYVLTKFLTTFDVTNYYLLKMEKNTDQMPSPLLSLLPIGILISLLSFVIYLFGSDALSGGSQVALLISTAVASFIAMVCCKIEWKEIEKTIVKNITSVSSAIIILLLIGMLSASWMISGVVPTLIYYGVQMIHPSFFLLSTCVICCIVSVVTGSSWTTVATIGVALLGIGQVLGFSEGWIAGAIISGAYFGDKVSPLSDTTVLAATTTGTPLYEHIRYLMTSTVPTITIAMIIYTIVGFIYKTDGAMQMADFHASLDNTFNISLWLLIIPIVTGILIARKVSPMITLFASSMLAGAFALFFQPNILLEVAGAESSDIISLLRGTFMSLYGSTGIETGNATLNELVATSGMGGMLDTIWLIICAVCFGGAMIAGGMIRSITSMFMRFIHNTFSLVSSSVASGLLVNMCVGDQYMSIILMGNMYKDVYKEKGYESRLLGRTTEDAVTVTSPLIPWNSCGMTQATVLGVSTLTYLPYCFFNLLSPLMSIFMAAIKYKIYQTKEKQE